MKLTLTNNGENELFLLLKVGPDLRTEGDMDPEKSGLEEVRVAVGASYTVEDDKKIARIAEMSPVGDTPGNDLMYVGD
jgi:hypothetical protein